MMALNMRRAGLLSTTPARCRIRLPIRPMAAGDDTTMPETPASSSPEPTRSSKSTLSLLDSMLGDEQSAGNSASSSSKDVPWWTIKPKQSAPPRQTSMSSGKQGRFIMNEELLGDLRTGIVTPVGQEASLPRSIPVVSWASAALAVVIFGTYTNVASMQGEESGREFLAGLLLNHSQVLEQGQVWQLFTAQLASCSPLQLVATLWGLVTVAAETEALLGNATYLGVFLLSGWAGEVAALAVDPTGASCGPAACLAGAAAALLVQERSAVAAKAATRAIQSEQRLQAHQPACAPASLEDMLSEAAGYVSDAPVSEAARPAAASGIANGASPSSSGAVAAGGVTLGQALLAFNALGCLSLALAASLTFSDPQIPDLQATQPVSLVAGALTGALLAAGMGPAYQVSRELDIPVGSMSIPTDAREVLVIVDTRTAFQRRFIALVCAATLGGLTASLAPGF